MACLNDWLQMLLENLPRQFYLSIRDEMAAAYASALEHAQERSAERPLFTRRLGQGRHFEREEALRRAAQICGLEWNDAAPHGYPKVFVETPKFRISELKVDCWGDLPADSEERRALAAANPVVGTFTGQTSIFDESVISDRLLAFVVVANPNTAADALPSSLGIGIPTANMNDWVFLETIENILAASNLPEPSLVDHAHPRLRSFANKDSDVS